jgi:primosomal protein N' (replication factor Y) (superfamily II helicase)
VVGNWVKVPFGNRQVIGLVLERVQKPQVDYQIKEIIEVQRLQSKLPEDLVNLILWTIRYYHAPPWEIVTAFLPAFISQGKVPTKHQVWQAVDGGADKIGARAARQKQLFEWLQQKGPSEISAISQAGFSRALIRQLQGVGAAESSDRAPIQHRLNKNIDLLSPTKDQAEVLRAIKESRTGIFLLEGITGSGKTLIYQHLAKEQLLVGKQVLVLVPEIGLIPQMLAHFDALVDKPLTYHSSITDAQRAEIWNACLSGSAQVVIGTRSSVFLPFKKLGLIVVDEEHDSSYKQQENPRYQARDIAVVRATKLGIPIVLGSATPSLESLHNANQENFKKLHLEERIGAGKLPHWRVIEGLGSADTAGLLAESLKAIDAHLQEGNQVLVFINRRGYAPCLRCSQCGWQARCDQCDSRYTYHKSSNELRCHRCDIRASVPRQCPVCSSRQLSFLGQGTERIAQYLAELFPDVPLIRIDRDATRGKQGMQSKLDQVHAAGPAILVGTQMLAKGHHFPKLSVAVIMDLDFALMSSDFRATEHLMQLLTQVSGRTGREREGAEVLLQTEFAGHPVLQDLLNNNYSHFAQNLMQKRKEWSLPPFSFLAIFRAESEDHSAALKLLNILMQTAQDSSLTDCAIIGPVPSPTERRSGRYRYQIQISSDARSSLHQMLGILVARLDQERHNKKLRWHLDVDPVSLD